MAKNMNATQLYRDSELMDDKRNFERFSIEVPTLIEYLKPKRRRTLLLKTTNLSAGGVYFNTPKPFPTGAEVKVEIFLHGWSLESWPVVTVTGRVLRSDPKGMSLSFNEDYDVTTMEESARSTPSSPPLPPSLWDKGFLHLNKYRAEKGATFLKNSIVDQDIPRPEVRRSWRGRFRVV